jgi:hypothetical protein
MAASLLGLGLWLAAGPASAQTLSSPSDPTGVTLSFHKTSGTGAAPASEATFTFRKLPSLVKAPATGQPAVPPPPPRIPDPFLTLQAPKPDAGPKAAAAGGDESLQYQIPLEPPGPQELFGKLDTEAELYERIRQQARNLNPDNRIIFPDEPVLSREKYKGRSFPPTVETAEPYYVCYGRLLFEDINAERYGWDLGAVGPAVSAGKFLVNLATVPYHLCVRPCQQYECSAGYCLPGDPVPYLLYPPEISITGLTAEGATLAALCALFP